MTRIGVILTHDNAIDRELREWCPASVSLHITRTQLRLDEPLKDERFAHRVSDHDIVEAATRTLVTIEPEVVVFGCTAGSFVRGLAWEPVIRQSMLAAGAKRALTTSGAVVDALRALGVRRIAVGTPYHPSRSERLGRFLTEAGFDVASLVSHTEERLDLVADEQVALLTREAARPGVDAIFLSCTALETRALLGPLSAQYGVPVVSAVQATMWSALGSLGLPLNGPDHPLHHLEPPSPVPRAA
jgi:maleate isomerase